MTSHRPPSHIHLALVRIGEGFGCEHWLEPELGIPIQLLKELGFARPIARSAPLCEEHGCHLLETCDQRAAFTDRKSVANKKCTLTTLGKDTSFDPGAVDRAIMGLPLATEILSHLDSGSRSIFDLYWRLVSQHLSSPQSTAPRRAVVKAVLDALVSAGYLVLRDDALVASLPDEEG